MKRRISRKRMRRLAGLGILAMIRTAGWSITGGMRVGVVANLLLRLHRANLPLRISQVGLFLISSQFHKKKLQKIISYSLDTFLALLVVTRLLFVRIMSCKSLKSLSLLMILRSLFFPPKRFTLGAAYYFLAFNLRIIFVWQLHYTYYFYYIFIISKYLNRGYNFF